MRIQNKSGQSLSLLSTGQRTTCDNLIDMEEKVTILEFLDNGHVRILNTFDSATNEYCLDIIGNFIAL